MIDCTNARASFTFRAFIVMLALQNSLAGANLHHVPEGFVIERAADASLVRFPMFAVFDDRGRLFVTESSGLDLYQGLQTQTRLCRVRLLEDQNRDGIFDTAAVFADKLVFPMGIACRADLVYVADPPDLVAFRDTNADGIADERKVILTGFGHIDNGSLHGLVFGPDGLLYMTMGSPDGYRLQQSNGRVIEGKSGALIRCAPDGSNVEVLSRGFENLVEVVFLPHGQIIGTDNWFTLPVGGVRDALVHLEMGGRYPLNQHEPGAPLPITGELLPAVAQFPAIALSGLMLYRGETFPIEMRGHLFSAQHNARKVGRHRLIEEGASFRAENFDFVISDDPDFHPSDVLESADGSLIVIDTGGWYVQHCPTGKIRNSQSPGGIYRVRHSKSASLNDPCGEALSWSQLDADTLVKLLSDKRPVVRDRAQQALVQRGSEAFAPLATLLKSPADLSAKQHAVWALAAGTGEEPRKILRDILRQSDGSLAAVTARALGWIRDANSRSALETVLSSSQSPVRLAAAQALARCGDTNSVVSLRQALMAAADPFEEHGLAFAFFEIASLAQLNEALQSSSLRVRKTALLSLDRPPHKNLPVNAVIQNLSASDDKLRSTALDLLKRHTEWATHAVSLLIDWLRAETFTNERKEGVRGLILAFQSNPTVQTIVADAFRNESSSLDAERKILVLEAMTQSTLRPWPDVWRVMLANALRETSPRVVDQAVRTIATQRLRNFDDRLVELARDAALSIGLRLEALRTIAPKKESLPSDLFEFVLAQLGQTESAVRRLAAGELLGQTRLNDAQQQGLLRTLRNETWVSPPVLLGAFRSRQEKRTDELLLDYLERSIQRGWQPSVVEIEALVPTLQPELQERGRRLLDRAKLETAEQIGKLARLEPLIEGGDETRGRAVFYGQKAACATCHRVGPQGGIVGPDLTRVAATRSGRDLLESIVFPNSTFAQGYESYSIILRDGEELNGNLARRSAEAVTLRDSAGAERHINASEIKEMRRRTISLMPEGFDSVLSPEELRDLLAFLQSLK